MCPTNPKFLLPLLVLLVFPLLAIPAEEAPGASVSYVSISAQERGIAPNTGGNVAPALQALMDEVTAAGQPTIIQLDAGVYHIDTPGEKHAALHVNKARHLVIRGAGPETRLILHNPALGGFFIAESDHVQVENLSIDHDPLPFTQGTVLLVNRQDGWFDVALHAGYPVLSEPWFAEAPKPYGQWGMIFDRKHPQLKRGAADFIFIETWEQIRERVWRVFPVEEQRERLKDMALGDRYVHLARHGKGAGIFFWRSRECGVRNVAIYASQSLAVGAVSSDRITVQELVVMRKPDTDRLLSTNADGVHLQQNLRGPIIENCRFEGMADDGINIYYYPNTVSAVISDTILRTNRAGVVEAGDSVLVFEPETGRILGKAAVSEIRLAPDDAYRITLDQPLSGAVVGANGLHLYNLSRCGADFVIRGNTFENHRRHGMMIKAPHGIIENNTIRAIGGSAMVLGNDPDWPEGAIPSDILLRNNHIEEVGWSRWYGTDSRGAAIQMMTKASRGQLARDRGVEEITLENTTVLNPPGAALYIGAARDIFVSGLRVEYTETHIQPRKTSAVIVENASAVQMEQIEVSVATRDVEAAVLIKESVDAGRAGISVDDVHVSGPLNLETIRDLRP